jgi:hypothetical protein
MKKFIFGIAMMSVLSFASCGNSTVNDNVNDSIAVDTTIVDSTNTEVADTVVLDTIADCECVE